jgi:flagellum-specific ATP synthase
MGHYPAIDVLQSVSRLASRLSGPEHAEAARQLRETMATLQSAEDLLRIGAYTAGGNPRLDQALQIEEAIRRFLRQRPEETTSMGETVQRLVHLLPK